MPDVLINSYARAVPQHCFGGACFLTFSPPEPTSKTLMKFRCFSSPTLNGPGTKVKAALVNFSECVTSRVFECPTSIRSILSPVNVGWASDHAVNL
jgi:hypothetical protein